MYLAVASVTSQARRYSHQSTTNSEEARQGKARRCRCVLGIEDTQSNPIQRPIKDVIEGNYKAMDVEVIGSNHAVDEDATVDEDGSIIEMTGPKRGIGMLCWTKLAAQKISQEEDDTKEKAYNLNFLRRRQWHSGGGAKRRSGGAGLERHSGGGAKRRSGGVGLEQHSGGGGPSQERCSSVKVTMGPKVTVSKDDTVILDGAGEKAIEERAEQVGGDTDTEVGEKKDRVTDALNATKEAGAAESSSSRNRCRRSRTDEEADGRASTESSKG
uniref:Uncharacterized protein n=1 Tax=Oryza punctata TaxID=4537 RepID=A0A0E0K8N7_ORYPU